MQASDRRDEAQPQPAGASLAGVSQSYERLDRTCSVFRGDTRAVIAHDQTHRVVQAGYLQLDPATAWNVLQCVLNEIRDHLRQQLPVPVNDRLAGVRAGQAQSLLARHGLEQFDELIGQITDIDGHGGRERGPGFSQRNLQQDRERPLKAVDLA